MNTSRMNGQSWVLCPSTRFPGKSYYFNMVTGEAMWNLSDVERKLVQPRHNFVDKWQYFPEPDSPPDEPNTSNMWPNYQPDFRPFNQPKPTFGQVIFPKNNPYMFESNWYQPTFVNRPMFKAPSFEANMQQTKTVFGQKRYQVSSTTDNPFENYYEPKPFEQNRQAFTPKFNAMNARPFPQSDTKQDLFKKRSFSFSTSFKEPASKKFRSHQDLFGESLNVSGYNLQNKSPYKSKPQPTCTCKCLLSKDNLDETDQDYPSNPFKRGLYLSKSMNCLTSTLIDSPVKNYPSLFQKPLKKHDTPIDFTIPPYKVKQIDLSTLPSNPKRMVQVNENNTNDLNETDLRHILRARKRSSHSKSSVKELTEVAKIKTHYTEQKRREEPKKKQVTFDLGVEEDSVAGDEASRTDLEPKDPSSDILIVEDTTPDTEKILSYMVVGIDALLTGFNVIEEYLKTDPSYILLIPAAVQREVESLSRGACAGRRAALPARQLARRLAETTDIIALQREVESLSRGACAGHRAALPARQLARRLAETTDNVAYEEEQETKLTEDPILNCCLQTYNDGHNVVLVTDNEDLFTKGVSLEIECYTIEDIKDELKLTNPVVSFDVETAKNDTNIEKTPKNYDEIEKITTNVARKVLFPSNNESKLKNLDIQKNIVFSATCNKVENQLFRSLISRPNQEGFIDQNTSEILSASDISRDIERLNIKETVDNFFQDLADIELKEKEITKVFKDGGHEKHAAKMKLKDINVYNLNEHLKRFYVRNPVIQDRIAMRWDEYFCAFQQIMETTLLDVFGIPTVSSEDTFPKPPLRDLLQCIRDDTDHRTVKALADKLCLALDNAYKVAGEDRLVICMNQNDFMKMLGMGTLLVKSLKTTNPNQDVEEGEVLLDQLLEDIVEPTPEPEPQGPALGRDPQPDFDEHRPEFVKKPAEVLEYLSKHFPQWQSYKASEDNSIELQEAPNKIIRTNGKKKSLLKFHKRKTMTLNRQKIPDVVTKENKPTIEAKTIEPPITGPKLLKKLAIEGLNLPPKMKEIDLEKREMVNKEMLSMIESMTNKDANKAPTKFYDLSTIIIDKAHIEKASDENQSDVKKNYRLKMTKEKYEELKNNGPLDLDILDYSAISTDDSTENHLQIVETPNDVSSNNPDVNQTDVNQTDVKETDGKEESNDSGFENESVQAYSFVQVFLKELCSTYKMITNFIVAANLELRKDVSDERKKQLYDKVNKAHITILVIMDKLKLIIERESNEETTLAPLIMKASEMAAKDKRISRYRQVATKCLEQARILQNALKRVRRITADQLDTISQSCAASDIEYLNIFE